MEGGEEFGEEDQDADYGGSDGGEEDYTCGDVFGCFGQGVGLLGDEVDEGFDHGVDHFGGEDEDDYGDYYGPFEPGEG